MLTAGAETPAREEAVMRHLISCLALILALAGAAAAQSVSSLDADEIEQALIEAGYSPDMSVSAIQGRPAARIEAGNFFFFVQGRDCEDERCHGLLLFANFDLGREVQERDFEVMNAWNDQRLRGRAFVLEPANAIGLDNFIDLRGGVDREHVLYALGKFPTLLDEFVTFFADNY